MRSIINALKTGGTEILAHKTRSVLSFLAIAVGSVVFIDAFAAICDTYKRLETQKTVSGMARLKVSQNYGQSFSTPDEYIPSPVITYTDYQALRAKLPNLYMISAEAHDWREVFDYQGHRLVANVLGVTPEWKKRDFIYTLKGRFFDWNDMENNLRVCVLVRKAIMPPTDSATKASMQKYDISHAFADFVSHNDLLGKEVKFSGLTFFVIGIIEELPYSKRPQTLGLESRSSYGVLMPITTMLKANFLAEDYDSMELFIDTGDEAGFDDNLKQIKNFLKIRFGDENFFVIENQLETIKDMIAKSVKESLMTISLGMLAFIAGGIGIMNVTLATVFARTKEIGIRRAIGASKSDIMLQFIVEAVMLGLIGGILGSITGYLWGVPIKVMIGMGASPIKPWMPFVAVLIAAFTSFLFAIYPAWVASSLKPADALRAE